MTDVQNNAAPRQRVAFSIPEFCFRNHLSAGKYHGLKNAGRGPKEMRDGLWVRITAEAEIDWQRQMEDPTDPAHVEARLLAEAKTVARGKLAGKLSTASPRHVSKQRKRKRTAGQRS